MKAHELIKNPENWTKNSYAKDCSGKPINPDDEQAFCYCMDGALQKVYGFLSSEYFEARNRAALLTQPQVLQDFNDTHTHAECYELLRKLDI